MAETPETQKPAAVEAPQSEFEQLQQLFKEYGQPVLIGIGLALVIVLGYGAFQKYRRSAAERASALLMNARSVDQLQQVMNQYASTPAAPLALLTMAAKSYEADQFDAAMGMYQQFMQKYPEHSMKAAAELGKIQCVEALGQAAEALGAYDGFLEAHRDHFLLPLAVQGKARVLSQLGRFEDAKAAYEDFIAANPKSAWSDSMRSMLLFVDKDLRASKLPPVETPVVEMMPAAATPPSEAVIFPTMEIPSAGEPAR